MTDPSQVTPPAGGDQGTQDPPAAPGWISALPDEYKGHEFVKTFQKPGDFVKSALEIKADRDALAARMESAIIKPGEKATDADRAAYYKALGVPETPDAYEFPKGEGVEHDPKMTDWAKQTFHAAHLSTEQATVISQAWDGFVQGMQQAQEEAIQTGIRDAETTLRAEWKTDYDKNFEETKRAYQHFETVAPGFKDLLEMDLGNGMKAGNHPAMLKVFHAIGKAMADDTGVPSRPASQKQAVGGFQSIYKEPNPPRD